MLNTINATPTVDEAIEQAARTVAARAVQRAIELVEQAFERAAVTPQSPSPPVGQSQPKSRRPYRRYTDGERADIARRIGAGESLYAIGRALGRHPRSVYDMVLAMGLKCNGAPFGAPGSAGGKWVSK